MYNVVKTDIEQTCFCCNTPTRLLLIEPLMNFSICDECLLTLSSIEYIIDDSHLVAN